MYLKPKSKLIKYVDFTKIDISDTVPNTFKIDEDKFEADILRARKAHGKKIEAESIENGDMVHLRCESENKKFNRKMIVVFVGKNKYSEILEKQLLGCKVNTTYDFTVGEDNVKVTILKIVRTVLSDIDDASIAAWNDENIKTYEDLKISIIDRQIDNFYDEDEDAELVSAKLSTESVRDMEFDYDEEELGYVKQRAAMQYETIMQLREENKKNGTFEESEEFSDDKIEGLVDSMMLSELQGTIIGAYLLEKENKLLTEDDYQEDLQKKMEYLQISQEEAETRFSRYEFMVDQYANYFFDIIENVGRMKLKEALNPR